MGEITDIRWIELGRAAPVRHVEDAHVTADDGRQLARARIVRPERPPDAEQVGAKPERVATLDRPGRLDAPERRDPGGRRPGLDRRRLAGPVRLAGPERDRAAVGHQQRVERVDEVRTVGLGLEDVDRRPERGQHLDERVVLPPCQLEVDRMEEPVRGIIEGGPEGRPRPLDEHVTQRRGHALSAEPAAGDRHRRRIDGAGTLVPWPPPTPSAPGSARSDPIGRRDGTG